MFIYTSELRSRVYCIQLNKEAGIANHARKSLYGSSLRLWTWEKEVLVDILYIHCQHPHMDQGDFVIFLSWPGESFVIYINWKPWHGSWLHLLSTYITNVVLYIIHNNNNKTLLLLYVTVNDSWENKIILFMFDDYIWQNFSAYSLPGFPSNFHPQPNTNT